MDEGDEFWIGGPGWIDFDAGLIAFDLCQGTDDADVSEGAAGVFPVRDARDGFVLDDSDPEVSVFAAGCCD